jgi:hypothetical protein
LGDFVNVARLRLLPASGVGEREEERKEKQSEARARRRLFSSVMIKKNVCEGKTKKEKKKKRNFVWSRPERRRNGNDLDLFGAAGAGEISTDTHQA